MGKNLFNGHKLEEARQKTSDVLLVLWFCPCVFAALYWFNYELVKNQLCERSRVTQANFSISFTAGAVSGAVSNSEFIQDDHRTQRLSH